LKGIVIYQPPPFCNILAEKRFPNRLLLDFYGSAATLAAVEAVFRDGIRLLDD
jgi:hypothetical protein